MAPTNRPVITPRFQCRGAVGRRRSHRSGHRRRVRDMVCCHARCGIPSCRIRRRRADRHLSVDASSTNRGSGRRLRTDPLRPQPDRGMENAGIRQWVHPGLPDPHIGRLCGHPRGKVRGAPRARLGPDRRLHRCLPHPRSPSGLRRVRPADDRDPGAGVGHMDHLAVDPVAGGRLGASGQHGADPKGACDLFPGAPHRSRSNSR